MVLTDLEASAKFFDWSIDFWLWRHPLLNVSPRSGLQGRTEYQSYIVPVKTTLSDEANTLDLCSL